MSQQKVDQYKKEKYNRKHAKKQSNIKKIASYVIATLIAVAFIIYVGYSVAIETKLYTPPTTTPTTTHMEMSSDEIESLRNALIQKGDKNVKGDKEATTAVPETTTVAPETTTAK